MAKKNQTLESIGLLNKALKAKKVLPAERNTGVTFFQGGTRICKVVKVKDEELVVLEVNVAINLEDPDYRHLTEEWCKAHHYGKTKGILATKNMELVSKVVNLIAEAIKA